MSVVTLEFLRAAALGDINRLRALLAQGVDINSTNGAHQTALMLAAAFKQAEIVKFLLSAGANANSHDELGLTATDWAKQDTEIIQLINSAERLDESHPIEARPPSPARLIDAGARSGELNSVILRANKRYAQTVSPELAATAAAKAPVSASPIKVEADQTVDSVKPPQASTTDDTVDSKVILPEPSRIVGQSSPVEPPREPSRVDIPLPQQPAMMSPAIRTLVRVGIVILIMAGGFVTYHLATSLLGNRSGSSVQPEPAPPPVSAATTPTKSGPVVGGELAGAELFLSEAEYPPGATVETGSVTVRIQVSRKGIVVSAKALDGNESLQAAAEKAARSSAFAPDKLLGKGSLVNGTITYNFVKGKSTSQQPGDFGFITEPTARGDVSATAGGPLEGADTKLIIPQIPKSLRYDKASVTVVVRVSRTGKVVSWRPLDGDARLRASVIKAARASTFDPDKLPGEGDVVGIVTYRIQ